MGGESEEYVRKNEYVYSDAARFKVLSKQLLDAGHRHFPNLREIKLLTERDPVLRAWIRRLRPHEFMRDAKFFFYREKRQRLDLRAGTH